MRIKLLKVTTIFIIGCIVVVLVEMSQRLFSQLEWNEFIKDEDRKADFSKRASEAISEIINKQETQA